MASYRRAQHLKRVANALTLLRLLAAPALLYALLSEAALFALGIFALATATDLLDGPLARRSRAVHPLGTLLDHGADAVFVVTGLAALAFRGEITPWLSPVVALAFIQYAAGIRFRAHADALPAPRAGLLGRWNGIAYFVLLGAPLVRDVLASLEVVQRLAAPRNLAVVAWLLLAATLFSIGEQGVARLRKARRGGIGANDAA